MRDLSEIGFESKEYKRLREKSYRIYDKILKNYIPKEKYMAFDKIFFKYDLASQNAEFELVKEGYKQGLIDGMELSKILKRQ
jgi:hypothetical protein